MSGGGSKTSTKAPKAPAVTPPSSLNAGFGAAAYNKPTNTFNYSSTQEPAYQQYSNQAGTAFGNQLGAIQDPQGIIQHQRGLLEQQLIPQFENTAQNARSDLTGRLGNRYFSTFGQLTGNQQALEEGRQRAGLNMDIENQAQAAFDRELTRTAGLGTLAGATQEARLAPYTTLAQLQGTGNQAVGNYNNALASMYNTQSSNYQSQLQAAQNRRNALYALVGQLGSAAIGGGANLGQAAMAGA